MGGRAREFRLRSDERLAFGLRRVARGRLESAVDTLRDKERDEVEAVHEARKDLKKLRSVIRLVRPVIGKAVSATENARYRDASRLLSGVRDAQVRSETMTALAERYPADPPAGGWNIVIEGFGETKSTGIDGLRLEVAAAIEPGCDVLSALALPGTDADLLGAGLRRTYRRGRHRLADAAAEPTVENLHELRKRVKDLWYHLRLVGDACSPALDPLTERADRLSDLLGHDHDLAVLAEWLRDGDGKLDPATRAHLDRLIDERRGELRPELFETAEAIYAEQPKAFARRIVGLYRGAAS